MNNISNSIVLSACVALAAGSLCAGYPDLLTFKDGSSVTSAVDWQRRRAEVAETILPVEYGALPATPAKPVEVTLVSKSHWPVKFAETTPDAWYQVYRVTTEYEGRPFSFEFQRWGLDGDEKRPILIEGDGCWQYLTDDILRLALRRGWSVVQFNRCEVTPDDDRTDKSALLKWAWMYHRVVDALLLDPRTDPTRLAISGHSRGGKTVLLAGATDTRISCVNDNCSGCGGSSPCRDVPKGGERIVHITRNFPFWFAPGWKDWIGREDELPFDQHFLTALLAPRGLFIREAVEDIWANPPGAKTLAGLAREVWKLHGRPDALCYSLRDGVHCHRTDDYADYLTFCETYWRGGKRPVMVYNEDNSAFFMQSKYGSGLNEKGLRAYVRGIAEGGQFTHFFACPNAMCANTDSKTLTTTWDAVRRPGKTVHGWQYGVALLHAQGVDPYRVWFDECRLRGLSPWLSVRMNDVHCADDPNDAMHSEFWLRHPEFRRVPGSDGKSGWTDAALDFAHPEVRAYWKAYFKELFETYDVDGVELDWMRFGHHLTPGREAELSACLDEVVAEARKFADAAAKRLGHPVLVSARVPSRPDDALKRGMDFETWAGKGWIDWLVPCNFWASADFGLPFADWKARLAAVNPKTVVIPGLDCGVQEVKDGKVSARRSLTYDEYRLFAKLRQQEGAEGLYVFNPFDTPFETWQALVYRGLAPEDIRDASVEIPSDRHD